MSDDILQELMLQWESARQEGLSPSAAELCAACPELTDALRRRMDIVRAMEGVLGLAEFDPQRTMPSAAAAPGDSPQEPLPIIPGYEIVRLLDQGGMGVVYEARQLELGRTVAIKMISSARCRPKDILRFRLEAESAARLQHPNFVQIFEIGQVNNRPYFSMEYVAGGSLAESLALSRPTPRQAAELLETLALAVHTAHERGIVHRDIKPANVMLTVAGTPKIADFGLAKKLDADSKHTHTGEILGTPSYMAPEQAQGQKDLIGPATDVYALGATLYECLAGAPPFQGASPVDSLRLLLEQDPVPPSRLQPGIPRDLEAICLKCLEKAPNQRYADAAALAADLRCFLEGQPVAARHSRLGRRLWKWARRHPQKLALYVSLSVLALIGVLWVVGQQQEQRDLRSQAVRQAPLVREILQRNCFECHGQDPKNIEKNLRVLDHKYLLDSNRRIVVPGAPDDSRLLQRIADGSMPPEEDEHRLPRVSEQEMVIVREWIQGGAPAFPPSDGKKVEPSVAPRSALAAQAKEILYNHCYECHKFDVAKGGIKILHHRLLTTVRKVVLPGKAADSELMHLITTDDAKLRMPPPPAEALSKEEIDVLRAWIAEGAPPFPKSEK